MNLDVSVVDVMFGERVGDASRGRLVVRAELRRVDRDVVATLVVGGLVRRLIFAPLDYCVADAGRDADDLVGVSASIYAVQLMVLMWPTVLVEVGHVLRVVES